MRTLAGQVERSGEMTPMQHMARVALACERLEGRSRRDVRARLGPPHTSGAAKDEWLYALGDRPDGSREEMLRLEFDARWRVHSAGVVSGTAGD